MAHHLRAHTGETYDGIAGDVLSQSTYLRRDIDARFTSGNLRGAAEFVLDGYGTMMSDRALARILSPARHLQLSRERALDRLEQEMAAHVDAANPTGSFFLANRTRREIALAPFALMRGVKVFAPYLDRDLYDLLAALPARLLMDRALHTDAIAKAWPQHVHVPYERKGVKVQDRAAAREIAQQLMRIAVGRLFRQWVRPSAILPGLAATALDGNSERLWHVPLLAYLDQTIALAAAASAAPRAR
jgi:asparagine synthase (glutamine-hydrolysing)